MIDEINPRLDEHGVAWCQPNCPCWKADGLRVACDYSHYTGNHVCIPAARKAAKDHKAMEAVRASNGISVMHSLERPGQWYASMGRHHAFAPDLADAILKAAEAAEARK